MKMFWACPKCISRVDFTEEMSSLFDENGESEFDPKLGLFFHTILCNGCKSNWIISISPMEENC